MQPQPQKDPLHGVTLEMILNHLVDYYDWEEMADCIKIRCFRFEPTITSSLRFLRKTPWARKEVEDLYVWSLGEITKNKEKNNEQ